MSRIRIWWKESSLKKMQNSIKKRKIERRRNSFKNRNWGRTKESPIKPWGWWMHRRWRIERGRELNWRLKKNWMRPWSLKGNIARGWSNHFHQALILHSIHHQNSPLFPPITSSDQWESISAFEPEINQVSEHRSSTRSMGVYVYPKWCPGRRHRIGGWKIETFYIFDNVIGG